MSRKSFSIIALLLATAVGAPNVLRASETFNVDLTGIGASNGSVTGTITTDGNSGALTTGDILNWNLNISDGKGNSFNLGGPNDVTGNSTAEVGVTGLVSDLSETSTQLLFNFTTSDGDFLIFQAPTEGSTGKQYVCFINNSTDCFNPDAIDLQAVNAGATSTNTVFTNESSGTEVIGTVTPEPGTAILWLTGIVLMIVGRKRIAHLLRPNTGTYGSLSPH